MSATLAPLAPSVHIQPPFQAAHDLDGWCVSMYPADLLKLASPVTTLQLCSRAPEPEVRDNKAFKEWVYVTEGWLYIKIDATLKEPLFAALNAARAGSLRMSEWPTALLRGLSCPCTFGQLVVALQRIACRHVRVQCYGQKMPLADLHVEPASSAHFSARFNNWDLGLFVPSERIQLVRFAPGGEPSPTNTVWSILTPVGQGYGSAGFELSTGGQDVAVKIYPRMVHQIKGSFGNLTRNAPKTQFTMRAREKQLEKILAIYDEASPADMGGLRIEVTVCAPTLREALDWVASCPVLQLAEYLNPSREPFHRHKIQLHELSKEEMLENARSMMAQAVKQGLFNGRDSLQVSLQAKKQVIDLYNAVGWNDGTRKPTAHTVLFPWWRETGQSVAGPCLTLKLLDSIAAMTEFFKAVRHKVPCIRCAALGTYNLDGGKQG